MGGDTSIQNDLPFSRIMDRLFKSLLKSTKLSLNMFVNFILKYVVLVIGMKYFILGTVSQEN